MRTRELRDQRKAFLELLVAVDDLQKRVEKLEGKPVKATAKPAEK